MDRTTVYALALPREVDILSLGKAGMIGLGGLARTVLGTGPIADGFALTPTAPASLNLNLAGGTIYSLANIDQTAWSSLAADNRSIVKQGIAIDTQTIAFTPPTTVGYSQIFLLEAQYVDQDVNPVVLPYYNAADPSQALTGPGGNGQAQPTTRRGGVAIQIKAGVAASSGSQSAPTPDAGWTPLYLVTLNAGQTQITSSSVAVHASAPFLDAKLPAVPSGVQSGRWFFAVATGTNTLTAAMSPAPPSTLSDGILLNLVIAATNTAPVTLSVNGYPASAVVRRDGQPVVAGDLIAGCVMALVRKGGAWMVLAPVASEIISQLQNSPGSGALLNPDVMLIEATRSAIASSRPMTSTFQPWELNSVVQNEITGAFLSLASRYITLPAGRYNVLYGGSAFSAGAHQVRLYDQTNGAEIGHGLLQDSFLVGNGSNQMTNTSLGVTTFTLAATAQISLDHACLNDTAGATYGDNTAVFRTDAFIRIEREKGAA